MLNSIGFLTVVLVRPSVRLSLSISEIVRLFFFREVKIVFSHEVVRTKSVTEFSKKKSRR